VKFNEDNKPQRTRLDIDRKLRQSIRSMFF